MSLPLTIRKNVRDSEVHLKEALERIRTVTGKDFEFEADWAATVSQLDNEHSKNNIGSTYHKEVMTYVAQNIESLCKNEMSKEAFIEATSANKIIIRCNDKIKDYWVPSFENGALVWEHKKSLSNVYNVANYDLIKVMPTPGLPLATRLNLEKHRELLEEHLQRINQATGASDWSLDVDFDKVLPLLPSEHTKNTIGDTYYKEIMGYLANNIEKNLKSETTKETFNEATSQHKVTIAVNDKQKSYWEMKFNNGVLELTHKANICNTYDVQNYNIIDILPSPGLPLNTRLNLEANREHLESNLERINQATGQSDWSFEADFEKLLPMFDNDYARKCIGDTYYKECLGYLANNIEKHCKNETVKEAFNEATSQHKIIFAATKDPKVNTYWDIKFENGALKITHKVNICNTYDLQTKNLEELIPSPGLPLVTRLNIDANREKLEEHLEKIREITGESYDVEVDWEKSLKAITDKYQHKTVGDLYYKEIMGYLANNLEKCLKNETMKEAFLEATSQRKFVIRASDNPKETKYWNLIFENGALVLQHKGNICNTYDVNNFNIAAIMPVPGVLSMLARLNIQGCQEKLQEHLQTFKDATGEDYIFDDSCLEAVYKSLSQEYLRNNIGDTFLKEALGYLAANFKKRCADDMVKEALNETITSRQITFVPDPKQKSYWDIKFTNGNVVVSYKPDPCNVYDLNNFDLEKLL